MRGKEFIQENWERGARTATLAGLALSLAFFPDQAQAQDTTPTMTPSAEVMSTSQINVTQVPESLAYPAIVSPEPSRQVNFPNDLVAYEDSFENSDYFEDGKGDIDVPQYYYRVMTAGTINIPELGVTCEAADQQGCLVIVINHFGQTAMFRNAEVDNGFTVAGRIHNMGDEDYATLPNHRFNGTSGLVKTVGAGQALLDHYVGRMAFSEEGANCGKINGCQSIEWHVVFVGDGQLQSHSSGIYTRPEQTATPTATPTATATPTSN